MRIAFLYKMGRPGTFTGKSHELADTGGSEGSMVNYAFALAELGHEVLVYIPGGPRHSYRGVEWRNIRTRDRFEERFDVAIALRFPHALRGIAASVKVLYCCDPAVPSLPEYVASGDVHSVITISECQKRRFQELHPIPEELYLVSSAGVNWADYARLDVPKKRGRCIYCSVPERGLDELVSIWPLIRREIPWATLHVTGSLALWGLIPQPDQVLLVDTIARLPGVTYLGVLSREALIKEQLESQILLLPGSPKSPEMCCMSAMECAAARNAIVVTDLYALVERVVHGLTGCIVPRGEGWQRTFAEAAVRLMTSPELSTMQYRAQERESTHDYKIQAQQWIKRMEELI